ncbi:MAG: hypothetical protein FJ304_22045 [Planctomycetes bacterium]|nr:hypothetical protein [Planctomycetota bacterium]
MHPLFFERVYRLALDCAVCLLLRARLPLTSTDLADAVVLEFVRRWNPEGTYGHLPTATDAECRRVLYNFTDKTARALLRQLRHIRLVAQ